MTTNQPTAQHTQEPWVKHQHDPFEPRWIMTLEPKALFIARMGHPAGCDSPDQDTEAANADRIIDCVNACAGINPEAVPDLLEVCQSIMAGVKAGNLYITQRGSLTGIACKSLSALQAAIAKAEGGA